jgi:transposase
LRIFCKTLIDTKANDCYNTGFFFGVNAKELLRQYKKHLSNFTTWERGEHANTWLLFPKNMGQYLSIDEVNLSMGELYTVVTHKEAKGKKRAIVANVARTKAETVINHVQRISSYKRNQVIEITLDMANSMKLIARKVFPKAKQLTDRFHIQKLALEAVQEIRIKLRWEALDRENETITQATLHKTKFITEDFSTGNTAKQ